MKKKHSQVGKRPGKPTFRTPAGFKNWKAQMIKRIKSVWGKRKKK